MVKFSLFGVAAFLLVFAFALVSLPAVSAEVVNVTDCGMLNQSDTNYVVTQDIYSTGAGGECLMIRGSNITLTSDRLTPYTILGPENPTIPGIRIEDSSDVTITKLNIISFSSGIYALSSSNLSLTGVIVSNNINGLNLNNVSDSYFRLAVFGYLPVSEFGFSLLDSHNNVFENIFILDTQNALSITNSDSNVFSDVSLYFSNAGLIVAGGDSNTFDRLYVSDINGTGIEMYASAQFNTFNNLTVNNTSSDGVKMTIAMNNSFAGCSVSTNGGYSLSVGRSFQNSFDDCSFSDSDGVFFNVESHYNVLNNSVIDGAGLELVLDASNNQFDNVLIQNSNDFGLKINASTGNTFNNLTVLGAQNVGVLLQQGVGTNKFVSLLVNQTVGAFDVMLDGSSGVIFTDSSFERYSFFDSTPIVHSSGIGQIVFIDLVTSSGTDFMNSFVFASNSFAFNGNQSLANRTAEVTLEGLPSGRVNHRILRNGATCESSICSPTTIDSATGIFRINELGTYSIASDDAPASTNSGGGGGGGGGGGSSGGTRTRTVAPIAVTPLSNTNSTPTNTNLTAETNVDTEVAPITGGFINAVKRPFVWVIAFLLVIGVAFFFVRARNVKAAGANVAPHMKK